MTRNQQEQMRIGATLRTMRELRGLTVEELAEQLGISRPYLSNIEAGRKKITPKLVASASSCLKVPQIAIVNPDFRKKD
ncbi:helix-turn-helix transcriptional regulator [Arcanobacterium haemolyticum]|nr:helix-turn-helix transcriptional regulator [Arcanobacterium haemolyticum]